MSSSRVRVAVVGVGHWGPNLVRNFHDSLRSQVRFVVDRDEKRLSALAARFPDVEATSDVQRVLTSSEVDAVVISTPTTTHHALAKAALEAGKHVLVEKPIAASGAHADELVRLSEARGRTLMVGHVFLFNSAIQRVKQLVDAKELGKLHYISMVRTNLGPIRLDVNAAWDLAAHDISIVSYWLGAQPVSASAVGGTYINPGVADVVFATLRYPGNVLVNLHASWLNPRKVRDITVVGDRRMLTFDDMNMQEPIRLYDKGVSEEPVKGVVDTFAAFRASVRDGDITIPRVAMGEPLRAECEHFLECIQQGKKPLSDGHVGLGVVKALEAIHRSLEANGKEEKVG